MPFRPLAVVVALVLATAGCAGSASPEEAPADVSALHETVVAAEHMEVWARLIMAGVDESVDLSGDPTAKAATLLAELDFRLRNHVVTVAQATAAHLENREALFGAATAVVEENRRAVVSQLTELYDEELATGFADPWRLFTEQNYRYARALRAGDESGRQEAVEEMERLAEELGEHLSDMTGGILDAKAWEEALIRNVEATTRTIQRQQDGGEPWAEALRRAVETMKEPAELLAAALAQDNRLQGEVDAEAAMVRAELSAAMAGTSWFVPLLTGRIVEGAPEPELEVPRRVLEQQTDALQLALERILDAPSAAELATLWHRHHNLFADLAEAIAGTGDVDAVKAELETWASDTAQLLEEVTTGSLDAAAMEREADKHVRTIETVIRAQADGT